METTNNQSLQPSFESVDWITEPGATNTIFAIPTDGELLFSGPGVGPSLTVRCHGLKATENTDTAYMVGVEVKSFTERTYPENDQVNLMVNEIREIPLPSRDLKPYVTPTNPRFESKVRTIDIGVPNDPLSDVPLTVIDLETTGLKAWEQHRVIQLAVKKINDFTVIDSKNWYINPERSITPGSKAIHGISEKDVAGEPTFREIAPDLIDFIDDSVLVAHNAQFETRHLMKEFHENDITPPDVFFIDTVELSRKALMLPKYNLDVLDGLLGLPNEATHGADDDVATTVNLLQVLDGVLSTHHDVTNVEDVLRYHEQVHWLQPDEHIDDLCNSKPLGDLPCVGKVRSQELHNMRLRTVNDIADADIETIEQASLINHHRAKEIRDVAKTIRGDDDAEGKQLAESLGVTRFEVVNALRDLGSYHEDTYNDKLGFVEFVVTEAQNGEEFLPKDAFEGHKERVERYYCMYKDFHR